VKELKDFLSAAGLPVSGVKDELVRRLEGALGGGGQEQGMGLGMGQEKGVGLVAVVAVEGQGEGQGMGQEQGQEEDKENLGSTEDRGGENRDRGEKHCMEKYVSAGAREREAGWLGSPSPMSPSPMSHPHH
jgi:hypothetical protein